MREQSFRKAFGRAVRAAREEARLTQRELAGRIGIADKYLSRIELGEATPSVLIAKNLAHAMGTSLDVLVGGTATRDSSKAAAIMQLVSRRPEEDLDRALRILRELLR